LTTETTAQNGDGHTPAGHTAAPLELREVVKRYPGAEKPAVDKLSLEVPAGEICVLVGPSGCGKTTAMRMVNRMIDITDGDILIGGKSVRDRRPSELRREIGYVIQQIGLFPHKTIGENIATVPHLLGWDGKRTGERVEELLQIVGLPGDFRDRYPSQLSGGQRQRVGVARALAADPPLMLMDEPFGALDPINRERLQNEFLRLQAELRKTIVFVTHDIDEAIKMGDRIAILGEQSRIAQFDTPEAILAHPENEFVSDFLGKGAIIKGLNLARISDITPEKIPSVEANASADAARRAIHESPDGWIIVTRNGQPVRWMNEDWIGSEVPFDQAGQEVAAVADPDETLRDALEHMLQSTASTTCCVDEHGAYRGVIRIEDLTAFLAEKQQAERLRRAEAVAS
jgi:osmoprotectant transport system ATP-binding protein